MIEWLHEVLGLQGALLIGLAMFAGAALQGSAGYGMALIASPLLVLVEPRLVPGPYLMASQLLSVLMLLRESKSMDIRGVKWALAGRVPGTLLAGWLMAILSQSTLVLVFGGMVLFGVAISLAGMRFPPRPRNLFFAGLLSAIMGTVATIGGPPMALVYQHNNSDEMRSTLSIYFIIGGAFSLITLAAVGRFGMVELWMSLFLLPGIVFGYLASSRIIPRLKGHSMRYLILGISTVSGLAVILKELR